LTTIIAITVAVEIATIMIVTTVGFNAIVTTTVAVTVTVAIATIQ